MASARALKLVDAGSGEGILQEFLDGEALTLAGALDEAAPVTIAAASTVNIGAAAANTINVSGTTTITAFDVAPSGVTRKVLFSGVLTLSHNPLSLILPGGANIATAAGDSATFQSLGGGNWRCTSYQRSDGRALVGGLYYETTVAWTGGGILTVNHNLGVIPGSVTFELVAKTAIFQLAAGQVEEVSPGPFVQFGTPTTQYGVTANRKTTTTVMVNIANAGLVMSQANGNSGAVTPAQVDLKIKVRA